MAREAEGLGAVLIEECLSGRTTNLRDPEMGDHVDGAAPLMAILRSHTPLDLVLIMLGTNDLKAQFDRSADDIVAGLAGLSDGVSASELWDGPVGARLGFIAPPALGPRADDPAWEWADEWRGGRAKSLALTAKVEALCRTRGHLFFDGNKGAVSSDRDPIHWDQPTHVRMGSAVAAWLATVL